MVEQDVGIDDEGALMIGPKKLSTIRRELEEALASDGGDPIERLDRPIAAAKHKGDRTDIMEGLKRFLESAGKKKSRKRIARAKA